MAIEKIDEGQADQDVELEKLEEQSQEQRQLADIKATLREEEDKWEKSRL